MKMDVSKFKKVSSDKKKTVLKHPRGHEIIIAHNSVSPSTRKQLTELPSYAEGGDVDNPDYFETAGKYLGKAEKYALNKSKETFVDPYVNAYSATKKALGSMTGGVASGLSDDPQQAPAPASPQVYGPQNEAPTAGDGDAQPAPVSAGPAPASVDAAPATETPAPAPSDGTGGQPEEALPQQEEPPQAAIQGDGSPDQQAAMEDKGSAQNYQKGFQDYYHENAHKLGSEDAAWQHDLQNGHVTPETYHDLFAKQDTLGKIGMLFGMLVSGAGSGLAHQSNAVLDSMNKEIENDFNAQKMSKDNAQNFLRIHQQQALNDAEIARVHAGIPLTQAEAMKARAEASVLGQSAALMKMNRAALHNLVLQVQKMPPGPQRSQAEAALAMVSSSVDQKNFDIADVAAGKAALAGMLGGGGNGTTNTTLLKTIPGMEGVAKDIEEKTVPGVGRAQIPAPQETRDRITALQQYNQKAQEYVNFARQHSTNWANLNPLQRQQIANQGAAMGANLQSLYRNKIKGGVYKKGEQEFIQQIIPDNPAKWSASFNAIPKVQQTIQDNSNDLQTTAKSIGLPIANQAGAPQQASKSGRPMVMKNGKWYYAK